ncbi:hypothetical protein HZZ00_38030 (plasmid) [Streptomyces sp. NEAU-sy36]|uniref:hypothetical protein n=1 Tax=unclassified Streptomyces TaxID=2593676 RepID=UPI0015D5865C|nr:MULTISPECIES: hypothetical protein [unclassified Streptomyces]QLJ06831.1 hypothetical protein HZZ00_38030 [Streptomyces sp. NEAU-sy36]
MFNPTPGDDRPTNDPTTVILDLLNAFLGLSDDTENAGRLMLLGPTGAFIGDASLSTQDMQIAIKALAAAKALTEATKGMDLPGDTPLDPALENELEEHCIGLDTEFLMELAAQDPNSAVAAFDEITTQWDGEL